MTEEVKIAFEPRVHVIPLNDILPSKMLPAAVKESAKYKRISASVAQLGLVEPLVVSRSRAAGPYLLLDGHVRFSALRDHGSQEARCVIADD
ncbi:MAG: plasmid partitioning protein RepB C-terminal domain-containing protein, partial [Caulobacteraceae bacterium]